MGTMEAHRELIDRLYAFLIKHVPDDDVDWLDDAIRHGGWDELRSLTLSLAKIYGFTIPQDLIAAGALTK